MTSKIFKSVLFMTIAVLMASLLIVTGGLYRYFGTVQETQLKDELSLAAEATERLGETYLESLSSDRYRLTWVSSDGEVLFDTISLSPPKSTLGWQIIRTNRHSWKTQTICATPCSTHLLNAY